MKEINFPKLTANDIQVRVSGKAGDNHRQYLLYQDSRVGMRLLDEVIGEMNYQVEYTSCAEQIYCCISIWDENKKCWIKKMDTGEFSNIAENKGIASDAFKRCCVKWGLGRELYTAPKIILPNEVSKYLKVSKIVYSGDVISVLELVDEKGNLVYTYPNNGEYANVPTTANKVNTEQKKLSVDDVRSIGAEYLKNINEKDKETFTKFMKYYIKKVENNTFNGKFNIETLWAKWISSEFKRAS